MEFNPSGGIEKSDQLAWNSDDHQVSGHVRSFTCTFCKRGFSNAQALGGHMNIHRKDRAKLKESSSDQSLLSVDMTKKTPSDHLHTSADNDDSKLESSEEKSCTPRRPWIFSKEDDAVSRGKDGAGELQQLDLFVETPSSSNDQSSSQGNEDVEKSKQLSHGSLQKEVDLELRLGLEHH